MTGTLDLGSISTRQRRIAQLVREDPERGLFSLHHYIDKSWMREAHRQTRKDGAVGVDGETGEAYAQELEDNLQCLLERFKSGSYKAPPVRRVWIPKGDGKSRRPIGIPSFEDKVLQRAVVMVLEPIYEEDFLDCSYGFRPGRGAHQALERLSGVLTEMGGGFVLEVDIANFFEEMRFEHLRSFLGRRVRDGVIRRTIDKWLKAGVLEEGLRLERDQGTPQGGVISPLLANLYLHEVVDRWFVETVRRHLRGRGELVRYADDMVMVFALRRDAERVLESLGKRLERYGLRLHPEKTRIVPFGRPRGKAPTDSDSDPGSFDFLGFRHYWGRSRKDRWVVKRKTDPVRLRQSLRRVKEWCRRHMHRRIRWQHAQLSRKLLGYYAYYGVTHNYRSLKRFRCQVERCWHKWLARRSQRGMPWSRFAQLLQRYSLPPARIVHRYAVAQQMHLPRSRMR